MAGPSSSHSHYRSDVWEALRGLVSQLDDVQEGQMMGHPALYYAPPGDKRKMFACAFGPGVALKLQRDRCDELLEQPEFTPMVAGGDVMAGWVVFDPGPDAGVLADEMELLQEALDWVNQPGRK